MCGCNICMNTVDADTVTFAVISCILLIVFVLFFLSFFLLSFCLFCFFWFVLQEKCPTHWGCRDFGRLCVSIYNSCTIYTWWIFYCWGLYVCMSDYCPSCPCLRYFCFFARAFLLRVLSTNRRALWRGGTVCGARRYRGVAGHGHLLRLAFILLTTLSPINRHELLSWL